MGWAVAKFMSYPPISDMADGGGHAACSQLPLPSMLFLPCSSNGAWVGPPSFLLGSFSLSLSNAVIS